MLQIKLYIGQLMQFKPFSCVGLVLSRNNLFGIIKSPEQI